MPCAVAAAGAGRAGDSPDAETSALLAMLAAGMTDASIARSLEWSMRTTQRRMAQLMSELGVTSRFQAGLAVRDRGWL
jgi:DNA-binding NarL/FixJ family response regulator